jgi:hypothetical protein
MNPTFFGDSFDIVKRFFCQELAAIGYKVVVDPMLTGAWKDHQEKDFYRFIGAGQNKDSKHDMGRTALFLDPDTGINERGGKQHVSFKRLIDETSSYTLVFSFDQSFSRQAKPTSVMQNKLKVLEARHCYGMYYNSHARFLFASSHKEHLHEFRTHLVGLGLPENRFIEGGT